MFKPSIRLIVTLTLLLFMVLQIAIFLIFAPSFQSAIVLLILSLAVIVIAFRLNILIFRRLDRLLVTARAFANGDFSARADADRQDELGMLGKAFNDMVQRVAANETRLAESESRFRLIINTTIDGIIVADRDGSIEIFNPAAERIFGYTAGEMIGKPFSQLAQSQNTTIDSELTSGKHEIFGIRKDGSLFPMEMALNVLTFNERRLFTAIVRDITERKRAADALYLSTRRLEGLLAIDEAILKPARTPKSQTPPSPTSAA
jgi:PAS domain S-box-containing protein